MSYEDVIPNGIGVVTGTATALNFPNSDIHLIRFKAAPANLEVFYLGTTANNMWPLSAGDDTGWVLADNWSDYWYKGGTGTVNHLHYWIQA